jgi:tetratricopeptide (TPR) repeat protein
VKKILAVLSILLAVAVTYAPSLRDGFVWDDTALILRDPLIRSWRLIPEGFNHFLFTDATASDFYRPIQRLTYTLDYAASAFRPGLYHLTNLIWHALAALALLVLAQELLLALGVVDRKRQLIAFLAALVWAVHPINSAAVIYVSGRADPLAAAFGFFGLYLVIRSLRSVGTKKTLLLAAALGAFLLSALSKETGLIFPALAIAFLALQKNWTDMWKTVAVAVLVSATYFGLRYAAEHHPPPVLSAPVPVLVKPIVISRAVAEYAGLVLFPWNLHMDRDVETRPTGLGEASLTAAAWRELQTLLGIVLLAALIYWMVRAYKRNLAVFVCLTFFVITYLPISGISALNATVAEHWLYLPGAFLFLAVFLEIATFLEKRSATRSTITAAASLLTLWIIFLGTRTFIRTFDWKDQRTFFEHTIAHGGDSARMLINLGGLESSEGKLEDAAIHFHAALKKKPEQPFAIINLAAIALKQNDFKLARDLLERATKMEAVRAQAYELLAVLEYREHSKIDLLRLRLASRTGDPQWSIEKRYVQALDASGKRGAALGELESCLRTEWYRAETWQLFGLILSKGGLTDKAAVAFSNAHAYDVHLDEHKENQPAPAPILPSL